MTDSKNIKDFGISLKNTNAIKGIAIMAMLVHHLFYQHPEYGMMVYQLGKIGKVCVALFLFLSSYGLTVQFKNTLQTNNLKRGGVVIKFLYKRFLKFYLNYWFIFVIAIPVGIFAYGRGLEVPYGTDKDMSIMFLKDLFGLNGFDSYNVTWWFNKLILTLYLWFPVLFLLTRNKYIGVVVLALSYRYPNYFPFVLGMMVASNISLINKALSYFRTHVVLTVSIMGIIGLCVVRQVSTFPYSYGAYLDGPISALIALVVVIASKVWAYEFSALQFLGVHSMNMYMIHSFIYYYFHSDLIYGFKHPLLIFLALLLISLGLSVILEQTKKHLGVYHLQQGLISLPDKISGYLKPAAQ